MPKRTCEEDYDDAQDTLAPETQWGLLLILAALLVLIGVVIWH